MNPRMELFPGGSPADMPRRSRTGNAKVPKGIVRTLELMRNAGIPVTEVIQIDSSFWAHDATQVETRLIELLGRHPLWMNFETIRPRGFTLMPSAVVELDGADARSERRLVPFSLGSQALGDLARAIDPIVRHLCLTDFDAQWDLTIRPTATAWLHLGAEVFTASFRNGKAPVLASATVECDALRFGQARLVAIRDLVEKVGQVWPFAFDALFVQLDGRVLLAEATISASAADCNTWALESAILSEGWSPRLDAVLANCSAQPRQRAMPNLVLDILARGQSHGDRWASGPLATSLEAATHMIAQGERPILVLDRLSPSQINALEGLAALGLCHDGPASHITILARTTGLPVVSRLQPDISADATVLDGDRVTLTEAHGCLFRGIVQPERSPVRSIAVNLAKSDTHPIAVTAITPFFKQAPVRPLTIGLCRSEMQILGALEAPEFAAYLTRVERSEVEEAPPLAVTSRLEQGLYELLRDANGALLNYRLIDADMGEILERAVPQRDALQSTHRVTVRGPRWALASGFYAWQIQMAVTLVARLLVSDRVDLVLTMPSAFDVAEVRVVRALFDREIAAHPNVKNSVRFGVMIETPRMCAQAALLPDIADIFCFGLNDLTASIYGLGREAWPALASYYGIADLLSEDPFTVLDSQVVAPLVEKTIEALQRAGAHGPIFLCGEPANSQPAHALIVRHLGAIVSVSLSDWPSATVSCGRERARLTSGPALEADVGIAKTQKMAARAAAATLAGRVEMAAELGVEWFSVACSLPREYRTQNWKVLKKGLVGALFGELPGRFFMPGWAAENVAAYVQPLLTGPQTFRLSEFPSGISCHARSETFDRNRSAEQTLGFIRAFDAHSALHVFPQQDANQLCFRYAYDIGNVVVEAGWGQAMYVFETERGCHPIAFAHAEQDGELRFEDAQGLPPLLADGLRSLLHSQDDWLRSIGPVISRLLGVDQFALEGYFDPRSADHVVVVDMDLPLDIAWNTAL